MKYNTKAKIKLVLKINDVKNSISEYFKLAVPQSTYDYWFKKLNETGDIKTKGTKPHSNPYLLKTIKRIKELSFNVKKILYSSSIKAGRFYPR